MNIALDSIYLLNIYKNLSSFSHLSLSIISDT